MLASTTFRLLAPFVSAAFVGGITQYFGLHQLVSTMIGWDRNLTSYFADNRRRKWISDAICNWPKSCAWMNAFMISSPQGQPRAVWFTAQPSQDPLRLRSGAIDLDLIIELENSNPFLIQFASLPRRADQRRALQRHALGVARAKTKLPFVFRLLAVPLTEIEPGIVTMSGYLRYDITYFMEAKQRTRRTAKRITLSARLPAATATAGNNALHLTFSDEVEV